MRPLSQKRKVGDLRPSHLLWTFGVGSVVDLPNLSVMVMGLDDWPIASSVEIVEERLLAAVRQDLGPQVEKLLSAPMAPDSGGFTAGPFDEGANVGVPVAPFPRWLVCPSCRLLAPIASGLFELRFVAYRPDKTRYVHKNCNKSVKPPEAVPARFLAACEKGHLDDFPWCEFVHGPVTGCAARLRLFEVGTSGEAADVFVRCEVCSQSRPMSAAFGEEGKRTMPRCRGRRPHLRDFEADGCDQQMRGILLGASNSWFHVILTALSIPSSGDRLEQLVNENWAVLGKATSLQNVALLRQIGQLRAFSEFSDEQIWILVERKLKGTSEDQIDARDLKRPEWQVFSNPDPGRNNRAFQLRAVPPPPGYRDSFERVVLVERLREVQALVGFTRIDSPGEPDAGGASTPIAPLARSAPRWLPATEIRGEGIFVHFNENAIEAWRRRCRELEAEFLQAHRRWCQMRGLNPDIGYPTMRYVLLHSFAHALIRQLALECGYTTASIRERIYSQPTGAPGGPMAGVLLYTAAADSEGTLGGLVSLGEPRNFQRHLDQALENLRLCTSDPLCAENLPFRQILSLHGAACHACLFAPETSCECGNKYLDRSVLVRTVEREDWSFFESRE